MINITKHHPIEIIWALLPVIPSILSIIDFAFNKPEETRRMTVFYTTLCIGYGFYCFNPNTHAIYIITVFMAFIFYLNNEFSKKGKMIENWLFPWLFFFNLTSFHGVNLLDDICMIIYAFPIGCMYIFGIIDISKLENGIWQLKSDNEMIVHKEKNCILVSAALFITLKVIFVLLTDTLVI